MSFFDLDGVDIHSIWVDFGVLVVGVVPLNWVGVGGLSWSDGICSVPLGFEVDGPGVPLVDHGRYGVHAIDSFHEGGRDSSWEEINESVFMGDFAEGDVILNWEM